MIAVIDLDILTGIFILVSRIVIREARIDNILTLTAQRQRIIPDLGVCQIFAADINFRLLIVKEIRHDNIVVCIVVIVLVVEIVFRLAVGSADVFLILVFAVRIGLENALCRLLQAVFLKIGRKLHGARRADELLRFRINNQIGFITQLGIAAEQAVVIQAFVACFLFGAFIQQNERAGAVGILNLDSAVLNQIGVKGFHTEIHASHCAGELVEMILVFRIPVRIVIDCHVHQVVVAAECTAAHLHIGSIDRNRLIGRTGSQLGLILVIQHFDAVCLINRE